MKIWIDDVRPAPDGYILYKSVNPALRFIRDNSHLIELIDLDHDAGEFAKRGGDYIRILDEMERLTKVHKMNFGHIAFHIHSANPVGVQNMRAMIERNGWKEIR